MAYAAIVMEQTLADAASLVPEITAHPACSKAVILR